MWNQCGLYITIFCKIEKYNFYIVRKKKKEKNEGVVMVSARAVISAEYIVPELESV